MLSDRKHTTRVQAVCLITVLLMEVLLLLVGSRGNYIVWFLLERYLPVPAMIFLGTAFCRRQSRARWAPLLLGGGVILWFLIVQIVHYTMGMGQAELGTVACVYALALPFCAVAEDDRRQYGLKLTGMTVLVGSVWTLCCWAMLAMQRLPAVLAKFVFWDGARFSAMGHSNICGAFLMMGIAFSAGIAIHCRKGWCKILAAFLSALQFVLISITNSRTAILMACVLLGGLTFCFLRRPGWKRLLTALLAGVAVAGALFALSRLVFKVNEFHLKQMALQVQQTGQNLSQVPQLDEDGKLITTSGQKPLNEAIGTMNGRTIIWKATLKGLAANPSFRAFGTEYLDLIMERGGLSLTVGHSHNSWLEILCRRGTVGLVLALVLTVMALWDAAVLLWRNTDLWKSCIALLSLCLLGCAMLEPYLFADTISYYFFDFVFMMCLGYMHIWRGQRPEPAGDSTNE